MENLDYIDNYFKGQLTAEEIRQFELRIEQDPGFAQDVAFYVSASGMLKEQAVAETMERFRELEEVQPVQMKQSPVRRLVYWVAAAAVSIGVIIRMFFLNPASVTRLADNYIKENLAELPQSMSPGDSISKGVGFYNDKNYSVALLTFKQLLISYPTDETVLKYAGITSLRLGNPDEALLYFDRLSSIVLYANPGKFYQALALMKRNKSNDASRAKALLNEVVKNRLSNDKEAADLLEKM